MLIAHGPVAVLSSLNISKRERKKKSTKSKIILILFAFFMGVVPDFDLVLLSFHSFLGKAHHDLPTHTPFFWIIMTILFCLTLFFFSKFNKFKRLLRKENIFLLTTIFAISTLSHIFLDYFIGYIMLFYPLSLHSYTLLGNVFPSNIFAGYLANPLFAFEILIVSFSIIVLIKNVKMKMKKIYLYILLILLPIIYLSFNLFIYSHSYKLYPKLDRNGSPIIDTDSDGILDKNDPDVDNNGVNNFTQANRQDLANVVSKVLDEGIVIYPSESKGLMDKIDILYGGLTIRRLITLAYWETGNQIDPVIQEFKDKNNYTSISQANDEFFKQNITLLNEPNPGDLILVYYKDETKFGLGICIGQGKVIYEDSNGNPTIDMFENIQAYKILTEN